MSDCCTSGLPQLRIDACGNYIKDASGVMLLQRVANDGTVNGVDLSTLPVSEATFKSMLYDTDVTKRLHYIPNVKDWTPTTADPTLQTFGDGSSIELNEGQISVSFVVPKTSPLYLHAIGKVKCVNPGVFIVDVDGNIWGYGNPDTIAQDQLLKPIPVERWQVTKAPFTSSTAVANATVTIFFPKSINLSWFRVLTASEHLFDVTMNYEPEQVTLVAVPAPTTTTLKVKVTSASDGILGNDSPVTGLALSSFSHVKNGSTPVTPTSMTESTPGEYTFTFTAFTPTDTVATSASQTSGLIGNTVTQTIP